MSIVIASSSILLAAIYVLVVVAALPRITLIGLSDAGRRTFLLGGTMFMLGSALAYSLFATEIMRGEHSSHGLISLFANCVQIAGGLLFLATTVRLSKLTLSSSSQEFIEMRTAALRDSLTGVFNRRFLDKWLVEEYDVFAARGPVSMLALDIDNFKEINDTAGHIAGDEILVAVADVVRETLRHSDMVARIGGDEFLVALPQSDADNALAVANRIVEEVRSIRWDGPRSVTVSVGVVVGRSGGTQGKALIHRADSAMYEAKRSGGNRVQLDGTRAIVTPADLEHGVMLDGLLGGGRGSADLDHPLDATTRSARDF